MGIKRNSDGFAYFIIGGVEMLDKSDYLTSYDYLNKRLTENDPHYLRQKDGYDGEAYLFAQLKRCSFPMLVCHDLLLSRGVTTQLDFVIILSDRILLLDVKHYKGSYTYQDGEFYDRKKEKLGSNPLIQLHRASNVLEAILKDGGINMPIELKLIFTHEQFCLYGNQPDLPIVLLSQIVNYFNYLEKVSGPLTDYHHRIASYLENIKLKRNPYEKLPKYSFESLNKGIFCLDCDKTYTISRHRNLVCDKCGCRESKSVAVSRMIAEFELLFPDVKPSPKLLKEWCGDLVSIELVGIVLRRCR